MKKQDKICIEVAVTGLLIPIVLVVTELLLFTSSRFRVRNTVGYAAFFVPLGLILGALRYSSLERLEKVIFGILGFIVLGLEIAILGVIVIIVEGELP